MRKSLKNKKPLAIFKRRHMFPRVSRGLVWGTSGAILLERLILSVSAVYWLRVRMRWHYKKLIFGYRKKRTKGRRTYWHRIRSFLPCTKKSAKIRMGKGKGKLVGLFSNLNAGFFLLEMRFTRKAFIQKLIKYLNSKLTAKLSCIFCCCSHAYSAFGSRESNFTYFKIKSRMYNFKNSHRKSFSNTRFDSQR